MPVPVIYMLAQVKQAFPELMPAAFGPPHAGLVHAEIMRHLMPDRIRDQLFQVRRISCQPFMRSLKNNDLIGHHEAVRDAARGERPAVIET
jgi:hypothetical protein